MKSSGSMSMKQSTIFGLPQPADESSLAADMTKPQQKGKDRSMVWEFFSQYKGNTSVARCDICYEEKKEKAGDLFTSLCKDDPQYITWFTVYVASCLP